MSASVVAELRAAFDEPFSALGLDATRDRRTVVASWPSVPVELLHATGFLPVFARGCSDPTPAADRVLEAQIFPNRLRQLVEAALTGRLREVAAVILPRSSDPDYKCFLYLRELARRGIAPALPPVLLFDLLHSDGAEARAYNADRTRALAAQLANLAGRQIGPDDVRRATASGNRARAAARRLDAHRTGTPRIAGSDALPLLGAFWQVEPDRYVPLASAAADWAARRPPLDGPRVLVAGSPVDGTWLHTAIEAAGGVVVAELSPFGRSAADADIETADDPFASVGEHYGRESLDARTPVKALMHKLDEALDGVAVVVISLPSDDASFGWDYPRVRELLVARSVSHLVLGGDAARGAATGDVERMRAMLSSSRARREAHGG